MNGCFQKNISAIISAKWIRAAIADILLSGSQDETIQCWDLTTGQLRQRLQVPRPYAGMNITGTKGLTDAQRQTLTVLGAEDRELADRPYL
jgi:WD40 repeat protein